MSNEKKKILIVDDSEFNRALLADILSPDFDIIEAQNGLEAVTILREKEMNIALMLLDIVMPEMDGFEVLAMMNKMGWIKTVNVIMISAESGGAYIDRAYDLGAIDYISRPFDERTVKHRVTSSFLLSLKQKEMAELLSEQIYEKEKDNSLMIEILSHIVEFRNGESGLHVLHVHAITDLLLRELEKKTDKYPLTNKEISLIGNASALHDIGKITIPSEILNKPGKFTPEEFEIMKRHTLEGAAMLEQMPSRKNEKLVQIAYQICRWHHERYDGRGYPDGLKGDEIPIAAQVVALADVYDALTSKRCYKAAFEPDVAVQMILNGECGAFNPILLDCLKDLAETLKKELTVLSIGQATEKSINATVSRILDSSGSEASNRTIQLLEYERMKFRYLSDISSEITFEYVPAPEMIKLSDWSAEKLGLPVAIVNPAEHADWTGIFSKEDFTDFLEKVKNTTPEHSVVAQKYLLNVGGKSKWHKVIAKAMWTSDDNPEFEGAIGKIVDVNEETKAMNELEERNDHDAKTGLFNHEAAKKRIMERLSSGSGAKYFLAMFDLDNFKGANDNYGHLFGDEVLEEVASRLRDSVRSSDIAARMGGDEFILFMEYKDHPETLVKRVFNRISGDFKGFYICASMGIACVEEDVDYDTLFKKADAAMYVVKRNGRRAWRFYDDSMESILKNGHGEAPRG